MKPKPKPKSTVKRKRTRPQAVEARSRQQNWQLRKVAEGLCPRCGDGTRDRNPRTGKPYAYCPQCRPVVAAEMKVLMARRRAKGLG